MPRPVRILLGLGDSGATTSNEQTRNIIWMLYGEPDIWEMNDENEMATHAHADECEYQTLIDKENSRYYLVAMTIDINRLKYKQSELDGLPVMVEDTSPKAATVVYFCEVSESEYKIWAEQDLKKRQDMINRPKGLIVPPM